MARTHRTTMAKPGKEFPKLAFTLCHSFQAATSAGPPGRTGAFRVGLPEIRALAPEPRGFV